MYIEITPRPQGSRYTAWSAFLTDAGLTPDESVTQTVLIWEGSRLIATGSRQANLLKCIAVDKAHRGEDLTAKILTALRQEAFREGHRHLFLYTKPENQYLFSSLFFYPVARTDKVLLMENQKNGIGSFLESLPVNHSHRSESQAVTGGPHFAETNGTSAPHFAETNDTSALIIGAAVMNCNPFTKGHRYLIETAAGECDHLYIFVLSEEQSRFNTSDRLEMVRLGTRDLPNVTVYPTGPYLISSATFPTYFLKNRENAEQTHCLLDIEIFTRYFAPRFGITRRYVGTEPFSPMTHKYNEALKTYLPPKGVELRELQRLAFGNRPTADTANCCVDTTAGSITPTNSTGTTTNSTDTTTGSTPVSASTVRALIDAGDPEAIRPLVPQTTFDYLQAHGLLTNTINQ